MNILIYADASHDIGTGHVMRCLALADFLKEKGCYIIFMTNTFLPGNMSPLITSKGYKIVEPSIGNIPTGTDLLIVDNYSIDEKFEAAARQRAKSIMVIDDLANRKHDCDILLDQNLYNNSERRYEGLVPKHCCLVLGSKYAILRDEFSQERKILRKRDGRVNRILVNFGGIDHVDMTSKVLDLLKNYKIDVDVVMGKSSPHLDKVAAVCSRNNHFNLHVNTSEMAKLIAEADMAIAAGGTSVWERCCLGLPSIIVAIADNQVEISENLAENNLCFYAGFYSDDKIEQKISKLLDFCVNNPIMLKKQSEKSTLLLDGKGKEYIWEAILRR